MTADSDILPWFFGRLDRYQEKIVTNLILGIFPDKFYKYCCLMFGTEQYMTTYHILQLIGVNALVIKNLLNHKRQIRLPLISDICRWYSFCCGGLCGYLERTRVLAREN